MEFGICLQSVVPLRKEPHHQAEMITQLLFGELYRIMETRDQWAKVQLVYDSYEGWICDLQTNRIQEEEFLRHFEAETPCSLDLVQLISNESTKEVFPVILGSSLPGIEEFRMELAGNSFLYDGQLSSLSELEEAETPQDIIEVKHAMLHDAMMYLNAPYLWGGRTPFGIDCSGLVQMIYRSRQIKLLRDAKQQASQGEVIGLIDEAEPGDLVFFDDGNGEITHVGMLVNRQQVLHCSGKVRLDRIDHIVIFQPELQKYTHKLRLIKRMF